MNEFHLPELPTNCSSADRESFIDSRTTNSTNRRLFKTARENNSLVLHQRILVRNAFPSARSIDLCQECNARNAGKNACRPRDAAFFPNGGVGGFEGRGSRSGFPGMEITKFHRAAKIRAQRGPPYSQKQVCRGNKTGINLHGRVGNNGRETGVHRRERKLCARAAT